LIDVPFGTLGDYSDDKPAIAVPRKLLNISGLFRLATRNSVCSVNIGVLRRPPYRGRYAYDPPQWFSGLLPVSAEPLWELERAADATSGLRDTQGEARAYANKLGSDDHADVERVRNTMAAR
jgi:hypothetical protein